MVGSPAFREIVVRPMHDPKYWVARVYFGDMNHATTAYSLLKPRADFGVFMANPRNYDKMTLGNLGM
jgi:hypothetical protein